MWRSLVARFVRDEEAAGSNPVTPTAADLRRSPDYSVACGLLSGAADVRFLEPGGSRACPLGLWNCLKQPVQQGHARARRRLGALLERLLPARQPLPHRRADRPCACRSPTSAVPAWLHGARGAEGCAAPPQDIHRKGRSDTAPRNATAKVPDKGGHFVETIVNDYITRELVQDVALLPLGDATSLLETGILHSLSMLRLRGIPPGAVRGHGGRCRPTSRRTSTAWTPSFAPTFAPGTGKKRAMRASVAETVPAVGQRSRRPWSIPVPGVLRAIEAIAFWLVTSPLPGAAAILALATVPPAGGATGRSGRTPASATR